MRGVLFLFILLFVAISLRGQTVSEVRFNGESEYYFKPTIDLNKTLIQLELILMLKKTPIH